MVSYCSCASSSTVSTSTSPSSSSSSSGVVTPSTPGCSTDIRCSSNSPSENLQSLKKSGQLYYQTFLTLNYLILTQLSRHILNLPGCNCVSPWSPSPEPILRDQLHRFYHGNPGLGPGLGVVTMLAASSTQIESTSPRISGHPSYSHHQSHVYSYLSYLPSITPPNNRSPNPRHWIKNP